MSEPLQAKVKSKVITTANVTPVPAAGVLLFIQEVLLCQPDVQIKKTSKYVNYNRLAIHHFLYVIRFLF